jgi:hypothetical protein
MTENEEKPVADDDAPKVEQDEQVTTPKPDIAETRDKAKAFLNKAGKSVKGGAKRAGDGARAVWADPLMLVKRIDALLDWVHDALPAELFDVVSGWFSQVGYAGLFISAIVGIPYFLTRAIRLKSPAQLMYGAGFVLLLIIVQYAAHKFLGAVKTLTKSSPSRLTSKAFLRCVALISEMMGLLFLALLAVNAWQSWSFVPVFIGLGICVLCEALAYVAIHPSLVSVTISEDASAGEEAIGIISFFVKAFIRVIPLVFGTGVLVGTIALLLSIFNPSAADSEAIVLFCRIPGMRAIFELLSITLRVPGAAALVLASALVPFVGYILFALYCLVVEVLRSILSLPGLIEKRS